MDFLKKAKAAIKDLEQDINKATASLGLGDSNADSAPPPSDDGSSTTNITINTPTTSEAASFMSAPPQKSASATAPGAAPVARTPAGGKGPKLPLATRKNLRDEYESKIPTLEANLSSALGVPWIIDLDPTMILPTAVDRYAKESPGQMFTKYVSDATERIKEYVSKYGEDGKSELNKLASSHIITVAESDMVTYSGCDISNGTLRLLYGKNHLGSNISQAAESLAAAVNKAGAATTPSALDFDARNSIKNDYDPKISQVKARIEAAVGVSGLTLTPNFEHNAAAIAKFESQNGSREVPRDWQKRLGAHHLLYFEGLAENLESAGFAKDEMLQEALQESIEGKEVALNIVDQLVKGTYNEVIFDSGVLVIQAPPKYWTSNIRDTGNKIVDLL